MVILNIQLKGGNKGIHTFPMGIRRKVNVIVPLEFELTYYNVAIQYVNHLATGTSASIFFIVNTQAYTKYLQLIYMYTYLYMFDTNILIILQKSAQHGEIFIRAMHLKYSNSENKAICSPILN